MQDYDYDFIIVGSGIAGLTAALYAGRSGLKTAVFEYAATGGQALNIAELENYPGIERTNGMSLCETAAKQAASFGAVFLPSFVSKIEKKANGFLVTSDDGALTAKAVLLATGAAPKKLGVKGEEAFLGRGVSYCATCDGPFFKNKHVAVIGGGNSACTEALYLANIAEHVTLIHRRDVLRAEKYVADKVLAHKKITVLFDTRITEIAGDKTVASVVLSVGKLLAVDGVFILAGLEPQTALIDALSPDASSGASFLVQKDEAGYIITGENMETALSGLFAAGDMRSKSLRQLVTAAADGAVAAHAVLESIV